MKIKPYTQEDLFRMATSGEAFDPQRICATYANPKNWRKGVDPKNLACTWIWNGPVICAFELAEWGLKPQEPLPWEELLAAVRYALKVNGTSSAGKAVSRLHELLSRFPERGGE